jgi:hypothetical protein
VTKIPVGVDASCARTLGCSDVGNVPTHRPVTVKIPNKVLNQNLFIT